MARKNLVSWVSYTLLYYSHLCQANRSFAKWGMYSKISVGSRSYTIKCRTPMPTSWRWQLWAFDASVTHMLLPAKVPLTRQSNQLFYPAWWVTMSRLIKIKQLNTPKVFYVTHMTLTFDPMTLNTYSVHLPFMVTHHVKFGQDPSTHFGDITHTSLSNMTSYDSVLWPHDLEYLISSWLPMYIFKEIYQLTSKI